MFRVVGFEVVLEFLVVGSGVFVCYGVKEPGDRAGDVEACCFLLCGVWHRSLSGHLYWRSNLVEGRGEM